MNDSQKIVALVALGVVAITFGVAAATNSESIAGEPVAIPLAERPTTPLRDAFDACGSGELADDDTTLLIDVGGEDYESGTDTYDGLVCVLSELDTPESVFARMEATRALDGVQTASWAGVSASWTYHPDNGLDLIITNGG